MTSYLPWPDGNRISGFVTVAVAVNKMWPSDSEELLFSHGLFNGFFLLWWMSQEISLEAEALTQRTVNTRKLKNHSVLQKAQVICCRSGFCHCDKHQNQATSEKKDLFGSRQEGFTIAQFQKLYSIVNWFHVSGSMASNATLGIHQEINPFSKSEPSWTHHFPKFTLNILVAGTKPSKHKSLWGNTSYLNSKTKWFHWLAANIFRTSYRTK